MTDDLEQDVATDSAGAAATKPAKPSGPQDGVDYFKKYTGLNSAHSKVLAERDALRSQLEEATGEAESARIALKDAAKPFEAEKKRLEKEMEAAIKERDQHLTELTTLKTRQSQKAAMTEKFKDNPAIVTAWENGDLRERSSFATGDEGQKAYDDYLTRMATMLQAPAAGASGKPAEAPDPAKAEADKRDFLSGATPAPAKPGRLGGNQSADQIRKQMESLDRSDKVAYRKKMDELTAQMDLALG